MDRNRFGVLRQVDQPPVSDRSRDQLVLPLIDSQLQAPPPTKRRQTLGSSTRGRRTKWRLPYGAAFCYPIFFSPPDQDNWFGYPFAPPACFILLASQRWPARTERAQCSIQSAIQTLTERVATCAGRLRRRPADFDSGRCHAAQNRSSPAPLPEELGPHALWLHRP